MAVKTGPLAKALAKALNKALALAKALPTAQAKTLALVKALARRCPRQGLCEHLEFQKHPKAPLRITRPQYCLRTSLASKLAKPDRN